MSVVRVGRAIRLLGPQVLLLGLACGPASESPTEADFGRASTGVSVTGTLPSSSPRDITLDVEIDGSGFDRGSSAVFTLAGVIDPRVRVNATRFLKASVLVANVTIAGDAAPTRYDVAVTTSAGKKGIGTELFAVLPINGIPGAQSARDINESGQAVGSLATGAYVWTQDGGVTSLAPPAGSSGGSASSVNELGMAVGLVTGSTGLQLPLRWVPGTTGWTARLLQVQATAGIPSAVNASGVVVGSVSAPGGGLRPIQWGASDMLGYLPTLSCGTGQAMDIDDAGTVVGYAADGAACPQLPAVWPAGAAPLALPLTSGYDEGRVYSINAHGVLVGSIYNSASASTTTRAALWRPDPATPGRWLAPVLLGTLGGSSRALRINDAGQVVGWSQAGSNANQVPFYWDATKGMKALAVWANGWSGAAQGISAAQGRIVGQSWSPAGKSVGVWWPVP